MTKLGMRTRYESQAVPGSRSGPEWEKRACAGEDPDVFFPPSSAVRMIDSAKEICGRCPVREACLAEALESAQDFGVWGGLSEEERREIHGRGPMRRSAGSPTRAEQLLAAPERLLELAGTDLSVSAISLELGTSVATINKVMAALEVQSAATNEAVGR